MDEARVSIGYYRGPLETVLAAIEAASLEGALIELDGGDPELWNLIDERCASYPELVAENERWRHGGLRMGPITIHRAGDPSANVMPIEGDNLARVRALLADRAGPEIAFHVNVRDECGYLLEAPDVGDNEIWVSDRLAPSAVEAIRTGLGENLLPRMSALNLRRVHDALTHDLGAAGSRYTVALRDDSVFEVRVDGQLDMWFNFTRIRDLDDLQAVLDQIQDVVMEAETEPWPHCSQHYHPLEPWPKDDWIVWRCSTTEEAFASFGRL